MIRLNNYILPAVLTLSATSIGCAGEIESTDLQDEAAKTTDAQATAALTKALTGLNYSSEGDFPVYFASKKGPKVEAPAIVAAFKKTFQATKKDSDLLNFSATEEVSPSKFFPSPTIDPDLSEIEIAETKKWINLKKVVDKNLRQVRVFRFGKPVKGASFVEGPVVTVVIAGLLPSGTLAVLYTYSIET